MAVSLPHGYQQAKVMTVSDNRPTWSTGPGGGAGRASRRRTSPHASTLSAAGVEGAGGPGGPGCGVRGRWRGLAGLRDDEPNNVSSTPGPTGVEGAGGSGGPGCGARGRRRGLAGLRDDAPSAAHGADGSRAGRRPRAHQVARPHSRIRRRPEHQRSKTQPRHNKAARPHRGRAVQSVSVAHRRITMMSGSPRPLSWRTLEIPSLAATSFAVPSMRGSS